MLPKMNKTMPMHDDTDRAKLRAMYIAGFKQQQRDQLLASQAAFKQRYLQQQQEAKWRSGMSEKSSESPDLASSGNKANGNSTSLPTPRIAILKPQPAEPMISQPSLHSRPSSCPTPPPLPLSLNISTRTSTAANHRVGSLNVTSIDRITGGVSFPRKLMEILSKEDPSIVTWLPSGRSFRVLNNKEFAKTVLIKYFRHDRITSFQRQLNLYGFRRVQKGPEGGAYQHDLFRRDQPHLCLQMKRSNQKQSPILSSQPPPRAATVALSDPSEALSLSDPMSSITLSERALERRDDPPPAISGSKDSATPALHEKGAFMLERSTSISKSTMEGNEIIRVSRMPSKSRLSSNGLGMLMSSSVGTFAAMDIIDLEHQDEYEREPSALNKDDRDSQASALAAAGMLAEHYNHSSLKAMPLIFDSSGSLKKFGEAMSKFKEQTVPRSDSGCVDDNGDVRPTTPNACDVDSSIQKQDSLDENFLKPAHPGEATPSALSPWGDREGIDKSSDFDFLNVFASENDLQSLTVKP